MNYPAWLPYPMSLVRTVINMVIVGAVVAAIEKYQGVLMIPMLFPIVCFSPCIAVAFLHHWFYGREGVGWFPGQVSWWEGVLSLMAPIMGLGIAIAIIFPWLPISTALVTTSDEYEALQGITALITFVVASYVFHLDDVSRHHRPMRLTGNAKRQ